jgi:hypothetical protein
MKAVRDPMLPFAAICTNYRTADFLTATRFTANFSNGREADFCWVCEEGLLIARYRLS